MEQWTELQEKLPKGSFISFVWHHNDTTYRYYVVLAPVLTGRRNTRINKQLAALGLGKHKRETPTTADLLQVPVEEDHNSLAAKLGEILYGDRSAIVGQLF